jgi:hypothetical protein
MRLEDLHCVQFVCTRLIRTNEKNGKWQRKTGTTITVI